MNKTEVAQLLTLAATVDNRTVTPEAVQGWHNVLGQSDYQPAVDAMWAHFRDSTDWLLPAHIKQRVSAARAVKPISDVSYYCRTHWLPNDGDGKCDRCVEGEDA